VKSALILWQHVHNLSKMVRAQSVKHQSEQSHVVAHVLVER
jgi:hypothetical protein